MRSFGLGLRGQIVIALTVAFVLSFTLLGVASVQLTQRSRVLDRRAGAEAVAHTIAAALSETTGNPRDDVVRLADATIGHGGIAGIEVDWDGIEPFARGQIEVGDAVSAPLERGGEVRVWVTPLDPTSTQSHTNLFLFYVALTGGAILILAYVVLTYLIVRPVSLLTRASERLAQGAETVLVKVRGTGEVARLAVAFNGMAAQLRADREALEQRLAELERTTKELETAQAQVVRSERLASVGRLAAGIAHEIGNPLSAILGLIELVRDGDLSEEQRGEFLERVQQETERINRIIRELLDFSRRDPSDANDHTAVASAIKDALRLLTPQKEMRNVVVEEEVDSDLPAVRSSSDKLTQVLINLFLNAADAMNGEGTITVKAHREEDSVVLQIEDTGPGIAEDILPNLFEPFVTSKAPGEGTGLGLAVCHSIVESYGGTLSATNLDGGGASFTLRLSVAED